MPVELKSRIVKDKEIMSGSPRIEGTRIRIRDIAQKHEILDYTSEEIAEAFDISLAEVYEALAYYEDNKKEIRKEIRRDKEFIKKHIQSAQAK